MDVKREVEVQESILIKPKDLPKPKPNRSNLYKKLLIGFSVLFAVLFVVYISLLNRYQQSTYYIRNFPSFGFGRCEPHLPFRSLQTFEFDPSEYDRFDFSSWNEYKDSSIHIAKHSDSDNVKILYNIHASDQYTLDNIRTYATHDYGYSFRIDAPHSSFFQRHCIKVQLTVSFPESLKNFGSVSLGGSVNTVNITANIDTKFNGFSLNAQGNLFVESIKAYNLNAYTSGLIHLRNVQINGGYLSSWNDVVIIKGVKKLEADTNRNHTSYYYSRGLEINSQKFILIKDAQISQIKVRSGAAVIKNVNSESVEIQGKRTVRIIDSSVSNLDINTLDGEVTASIADSNQVSIYNKKGSVYVNVKSLGKLNATEAHHQPHSHYGSQYRYYSGYRPHVNRTYYSFEVLSLDGRSILNLPSTFEGKFEASARSGQADVKTVSDSSKLHFVNERANFKFGYYGNNRNSANKAKVETGGRYTGATIHFN